MRKHPPEKLTGPWQCTLPDGREVSIDAPGCWDAHIPEKDIAGPVRWTHRFSLPDAPGAHWLLRFERLSYACEVLVNGIYCDSHEGMWDAFDIDISQAARPGGNEVCVLVTKPGYGPDDRYPLRQVLSGFIPDVLCTFGGIWGGVWVLRADPFAVAHHHMRGRADGAFRLTVWLTGVACCTLRVRVFDAAGEALWQSEGKGSGEVILRGRLPDPRPWSPADPALYRYECEILADGASETVHGAFGLRDITADGSRLLLNGTPVYLRGALHWGMYDRRITPLPTVEEIEGELVGIHAYGLNMVKHCLYIPSDAYLDACDRAGVLQWIELPLWLPEKTDALARRIRREYPRILRALAGHPSVVLISLGCELDTAVEPELLHEMYETARALTDTLVCDNSGSGECYGGNPERSSDFFDYHFYADLHNMEPLMEHFTPAWRNTQPWLFGEFCDSDTLRDLLRVRAAHGGERLPWESDDPHRNPLCMLKPDFCAQHHDARMSAYGIDGQFDRLYALAVDHSLTHRKVTLEMTRAFPEICGYNITSIRDIPICPNGLFDELGRAKFPQDIFRQSTGELTLCPAWDLTRIWAFGDRVQPRERYSFFGGQRTGLHVLLSNYGTRAIESPELRWELADGDRVLASGVLRSDGVSAQGTVRELGAVRAALPETDTPATLVLSIEMDAAGQTVRNAWPMFVYPEPRCNGTRLGVFDPAGLLEGIDRMYEVVSIDEGAPIQGIDAVVATHLSTAVRRYAEGGGVVLLMQRGLRGVLPTAPAAFWREGMIDRAGPHFLGDLPYRHFADDLRYWSVATDTVFDLDRLVEAGFPAHTELMARYDCRTWIRSAYVLALPCGDGRILATTLRLEGGIGKQPSRIDHNVFGRWFLHEGLRWLAKAKE